MNLETMYLLDERDYLAYQLFSASTNERIKRKRKREWVFTIITFVALAFLFYSSNKSFLGNYFIGVAILTALFFPLYSRWRYKNHYLRHVKETYKNNFDKQVKVKLTRETIETNDEGGQSIINTSQLTDVFETKEHFFVKLHSGQALVIPKNKLHNLQEFKQAIYELVQALKINHTKNENWVWK